MALRFILKILIIFFSFIISLQQEYSEESKQHKKKKKKHKKDGDDETLISKHFIDHVLKTLSLQYFVGIFDLSDSEYILREFLQVGASGAIIII